MLNHRSTPKPKIKRLTTPPPAAIATNAAAQPGDRPTDSKYGTACTIQPNNPKNSAMNASASNQNIGVRIAARTVNPPSVDVD